jgi:hypothetical protein
MTNKPRSIMSFTEEAQRLMRKSPLMRAMHPEIYGENPPEEIKEAPPQTAPESAEKALPQTIPPETVKEVVPQTIPPETVKEVVPQTIPPETVKEVVPQTIPPEAVKEAPPQPAPSKTRGNSKYDLEPLQQLVGQHGSNWTYDQYLDGYRKITGTNASRDWLKNYLPRLKRERQTIIAHRG